MSARFYRQNIAQYNPLSFEEMAYAPTMMRALHDQMDMGYSTLNTEFGDYNALNSDRQFLEDQINPAREQLNTLADDLAKNGFDRNKMSDLRKLKAQKDKMFGQSGVVGQAQAKYQQFVESSERIRDQFKNAPGIAESIISEMANSPGMAYDESGNLNNTSLNIPSYVKHYDAKEINDILNSQIDNIKDTLIKDLGFENLGSISSIQDLWRSGQIDGRKAKDVADVLMAQLSPEVKQSARQYGARVLGDADLGEQYLFNQIAGAAQGRATEKRNTKYQVITNEQRKLEAAKNNSLEGLTRTPGPAITREMDDVLDKAGLTFSDNGNDIVESTTMSQDIRKFFDEKSVGIFGGWHFINRGVDELGEFGEIIADDPSILLHINNPLVMGEKINNSIKSVSMKEKIYKEQQQAIKKDMTESVANYKDAYPELNAKSNKEVYDLVLQSRNNLSTIYSDVIAPKDIDLSRINDQILGKGSGTGDLFRREIYVQGQGLGTGDEFIEKLGYDSFADFKENGNPQMEAGVIFAGKSPGSFVLNAVDSDGNPVTAEVQSNKEIANNAQLPNAMLKKVQKGEIFKEIPANDNSEDALSLYKQVKQPDEGNSMYFMFDVNKQQPYYIEAPSGMTPSDVRNFAETNENEKYTLSEAINTSISTIFYGQGGSADILRK